jgi:hypothetical protein
MFRITAGIREYFNYRLDAASFRLEEAKLHGLQVPMQRDFRSRAERLAELDPEARLHAGEPDQD